MANQLQEKGVVPDVLNSVPSIDLGLEVAYENNIVKVGAPIPRNETVKVPTLKITNAASKDSSSKYTIIMDDPDLFVKNDPTGHVRHWLQTGLTASSDGVLKATEEPVTPYLECAPGPGPAHRYTFILCKEPSSSSYTSSLRDKYPSKSGTHDLKDRMGFYSQKFIDEEGLTVVGCTFMLVSPNASAIADNLMLGAQALAHKVTGQ
ncbi:hypothetical protein O988_05130 [Pseudogymnoascus sp. VKM F-3808]|nr:hypothetical protein O988_05130 [Pseudogymnoascus sp. VKM F-3808]